MGINKDATGARSALPRSQLILLDKMVKDVLLVSMGQAQVSRISASIQTFEQIRQTLMTGNSETGQDALPETSEVEHTVVMERIMVEWGP